jgi:amino acid transporter
VAAWSYRNAFATGANVRFGSYARELQKIYEEYRASWIASNGAQMTKCTAGASRNTYSDADRQGDIRGLHSMGYAQELERRMGRFSNFAISFSIICILSGGINSLAQGISSVGGAAIGIGWPIGCLISGVFAVALAQIASAYPTAGGLYHWGTILGNRGSGWLTAWLNLIGLVMVLGAINVGTWTFFLGAFGPTLGLAGTYSQQLVFIILITTSQALVNHLGIRLTTRLTDLSGYLIFAGSLALAGACLVFAPQHEWSRLWTFHNYSGGAGGGVWPESSSISFLFLLALLLPIYTITGYDASAHTAEETRHAAVSVPRAMISSVVWSAAFGWLFLCSIVIAIPDMDSGAAQGWAVFFWTMDQIMPSSVKNALYVTIVSAQFLCGLATVTSVSRMIFAFARDGGLPASRVLRRVSPRFRTPVSAIWAGSTLAVLFTAYTPLYTTIVSAAVIFLFLSFTAPITLGLSAWRTRWTKMGPWNIGNWFCVFAVLSILGMILIFVIGVQEPNRSALWITAFFLVLMGIVWFAFDRRRFRGPPIGAEIVGRRQAILDAERAVGEVGGGPESHSPT